MGGGLEVVLVVLVTVFGYIAAVAIVEFAVVVAFIASVPAFVAAVLSAVHAAAAPCGTALLLL